MTRARRRQSRQLTEAAEWARRRDDVLAYNAGDALAECTQFWEREPDVPDELRPVEGGPSRYWHILATDIPHPEIEAERRAQWLDLKARRMAWLREKGYR